MSTTAYTGLSHAGSPELKPGLLHGWQGQSCRTCFLAQCTLVGSWKEKQSQNSNQDTPTWNVGASNSRLRATTNVSSQNASFCVFSLTFELCWAARKGTYFSCLLHISFEKKNIRPAGTRADKLLAEMPVSHEQVPYNVLLAPLLNQLFAKLEGKW